MLRNEVSRVLVLAPVAVLPGWKKEVTEVILPHVPCCVVEIMNSEVSKKKRVKLLEAALLERGGPMVIISSHQLVTTMEEEFTAGRWDYAILDEGHVIKNPQTKLSKAMHCLRTRHRLLLTGTPIQNHLQDFWAVLNWATEGRCLGSLRHFNATIAEPIHKGQDPLANEETRDAAHAAMRLLVRLCRPLLLQRKKKDHLLQANAPVQLPPKKEFVVWVALSSQQKEEYRRYLRSTAALSALTRTSYPVEVINTLKVLCRHPALLQISRSKAKGGQRKEQPSHRDDEVDELTNNLQRLHVNPSQGEEEEEVEHGDAGDLPEALLDAHALLKGSIKLRLLLQMVRQLLREDHRVLVFSQSQTLLRLIQSLLAHYGIASSRIDGSTTYKERQVVIEEFNRPLSPEECYCGPRVCLLTTKACGFGITLTGADRVIIFDPCKWQLPPSLFIFFLS